MCVLLASLVMVCFYYVSKPTFLLIAGMTTMGAAISTHENTTGTIDDVIVSDGDVSDQTVLPQWFISVRACAVNQVHGGRLLTTAHPLALPTSRRGALSSADSHWWCWFRAASFNSTDSFVSLAGSVSRSDPNHGSC